MRRVLRLTDGPTTHEELGISRSADSEPGREGFLTRSCRFLHADRAVDRDRVLEQIGHEVAAGSNRDRFEPRPGSHNLGAMETSDILIEAFGRVVEDFERALIGLTADELAYRPDAEANSIAWLAWHAARVQDDHIAELAGRDQAWHDSGFEDRFDFGFDTRDVGYGHTSDQVATVRTDGPEILLEYLRAVTDRTNHHLSGIDSAELDRIVDRNWDPPVTAGVRIVSVVDDCIQHAGQAAYVRGLIERRT